jgi:hypothetical protein
LFVAEQLVPAMNAVGDRVRRRPESVEITAPPSRRLLLV